MLFCHIQMAPFAHERIRHFSMYFTRNVIITAKHVVTAEQIKYLGRYMSMCLIVSCAKEAIYL